MSSWFDNAWSSFVSLTSDQDIKANLLPLVNRQAHHPRIRILSLDLNVEEPIIKPPLQVDWERYLPRIEELGLKLPNATTPAASA
jgi:hypothetical protein